LQHSNRLLQSSTVNWPSRERKQTPAQRNNGSQKVTQWRAKMILL
jgi:hypothetical protein